eukprot:10319502-Alexandrium_andersonii.AAC.1
MPRPDCWSSPIQVGAPQSAVIRRAPRGPGARDGTPRGKVRELDGDVRPGAHGRHAAEAAAVARQGAVDEVVAAALQEGAQGLVAVALHEAVHGLVGGALMRWPRGPRRSAARSGR